MRTPEELSELLRFSANCTEEGDLSTEEEQPAAQEFWAEVYREAATCIERLIP